MGFYGERLLFTCPTLVYSTPITVSHFALHSKFTASMVDHTHLHSPASAAGEVYTNPFIYRLPAINWVDDQADEMLVDRCSSVTLRDHAPGLSANLRPMNIGKYDGNIFVDSCLTRETSDLVAETSSVVNKLDDLRQCTNTHWPAIVQESQPSRTRSSSPENFFSDRTKCPATPIKIQVRSGGKCRLYVATFMSQIFIDHWQPHSATRGMTRRGPLPARSIR